MSALMSLTETAEYLFGSDKKSNQNRVVRLIKAGAIRALQDGRRYWIVRSSLTDIAA